MNEEEAIERLKYIDRQYDCNNYYSRYDLDCIETVLNLLENKDKEIQFQKEINKSEQNRHKQTEKSLKGQLKKKEKMIDLMAEEISNGILNTCPLADYDVDLDCENKCKDDYKACWKKYFERKIEEN